MFYRGGQPGNGVASATGNFEINGRLMLPECSPQLRKISSNGAFSSFPEADVRGAGRPAYRIVSGLIHLAPEGRRRWPAPYPNEQVKEEARQSDSQLSRNMLLAFALAGCAWAQQSNSCSA